MKKKLFIILGTLVLSINLVLSFAFKDNKEENKEISKALEILSKPEGIQAFTLEGEKTNKEFNDLIKNYVLDKITCKNGSVATYNKATNEVSLSNIHMPDYCTMNFKYTIYGKLLADNPTIKTRTDFSTTYTETNTGTLFKSTESIVGSIAKDVYYFAGNAQNNWVKFGGFYWRIIRTNHDGSIRLLYAGTSPDTTSGYIGTSAFNTEYNSPKYVGYMYGNSDTTLEEARTNTNDSTIKAYMDNWYINNLTSYTKYLSKDAVYCNDRQLDNGQSWTYATSPTSQIFYMTYTTRLNWDGDGANAQPTYNCTNSKDAFSGSNTEAKLTYPISLMTADEIVYAGGKANNNVAAWYYLNSVGFSITDSIWWWLLSPMYWNGYGSLQWSVHGSDGQGRAAGRNVYDPCAIRPVISLKGNLIWKSGDGSSTNPYEVEDLPPTLSEKLLIDNPTIKTRSDFNTIYTETNTGTLFKSTESIAGSTAETVYYFAGDAMNNWVKFGGFYWRIIRTNSDGSVRLLYSGKSPDSTEGYIGSSGFNTEYNSPKYVGYMYGEDDSTLDGIRANTKDSTIKTYIDNWYSNNLSAYTKYLSKDAVYCNDRKAPDYDANNSFKYYVYTRLKAGNPTYDCEDAKDAFSGSNSEAKLTYPIALMTVDEVTYAGGVFGAELTSPYVWYYINSTGGSIIGSNSWWLLSPYNYWANKFIFFFSMTGSDYPGRIGNGSVNSIKGVRPVISIKSDALWSKGNGSPENPYEIIYN